MSTVKEIINIGFLNHQNGLLEDAENAYIKSGLNDGDIVILSRVKSGEKVKVNE